MSAEVIFKLAVQELLAAEVYPSPKAIQEHLGATVTHNLNGRQNKWRREVMEPWMVLHPNHPITIQRRINEVFLPVLDMDTVIDGLRQIEADLR